MCLQLASRASALPVNIGRHSTVTSDVAIPYQQPLSGHHFESQLDIGRPPSWLISCPPVPCDNAATYHGFSTNMFSADAAETTAARGSAVSPKTTPSSLIHACQDANHPLDAYQRPGQADKEPSSRLSSLMPPAAYSRERPRPAAEPSDFGGHLHGMNAAPVHPLKQVQP